MVETMGLLVRVIHDPPMFDLAVLQQPGGYGWLNA